jgi:hypothetical protein
VLTYNQQYVELPSIHILEGKMEFIYETHAVDPETFASYRIGDTFEGGVVIEGTADEENDQFLLITRREEQAAA